MAIDVGSEDPGDFSENSEINVTPFIDVMLVLLIVFMVAAPLSTVDVAVELPTSRATPHTLPPKPIFVTISRDLMLTVGDDPVDRPALGEALKRATEGDNGARIFLRGDRGVPYGELMQVMNLLRSAGYLRIGLVGLEDASDRSVQ